MDKFLTLAEQLKKAAPQGEGSRGGQVVGHTSSGKPIYQNHLHEGHANFRAADHKDAANHHGEIIDRTRQIIQDKMKADPKFQVPEKVVEFIQHHDKQMKMHNSKANSKADVESRNKKQVADVLRNQALGIKKSMDTPYYVAVVPVNPLGQVLLGKRKEDGIWTTPAGGADIGETPEAAAVRECWEEANLIIQERQLEPMGVKLAPNGKPVHCFLYRCNQISTSSKSDPDREVSEWKWIDPREFPKELSSEKNKNRLETINQAMLKFFLIKKSEIAMNGEHGNPSVNTEDFAIENASSQTSPWQSIIADKMQDYCYGTDPIDFELDSRHILSLVKVDEGLYSGFVKRDSEDDLPETVLTIEKQSIPSMIQFMRAKEVLPLNDESFVADEPMAIEKDTEWDESPVEGPEMVMKEGPQEEQDAHGVTELLSVLQSLRAAGMPGTVNINFYKGKDKIPGGLADKKSPKDFDKEALKEGVKVEMEHTSDPKIAIEIAMDHLTEDKEYYKKLKTIEKSYGELSNLLEPLIKGKRAAVGETRIWHGKQFKKIAEGQWVPVTAPSAPAQEKPTEAAPAKPEAAPTPTSTPDEPQNNNQLEAVEASPNTDHLKPSDNLGAETTISKEDLKSLLENGPYSIVSAGVNPNDEEDKALTDEQIAGRYKELEEDISNLGYKYTVVDGNYDGEEKSYMVFHAKESDIDDLGKKYKQDSVVHTKDGQNKMTFTTGENAGKHHKGESYEEVPDAENYYSVVKTSDGSKIKFSMGFDFGKHHD